MLIFKEVKLTTMIFYNRIFEYYINLVYFDPNKKYMTKITVSIFKLKRRPYRIKNDHYSKN